MAIATELLKQTSSILSRAARTNEAIQEIVGLIGPAAGLDLIQISIANPFRGTSVDSTHEKRGSQPAAVVLQRDLRSGAHVYGHLEIQASRPTIKAVELFQFLNTLESLLTNFAVLESRRSEKVLLRAHLNVMREELRTVKLAARAQSLLARTGLSLEAAREWLHGESHRAQVPLSIAAERIIARETRRQREAA